MDKLVAKQLGEAPDHAVLPNAGNYDVRAIALTWPDGEEFGELVLEASTPDDYAILKFSGVEDVYVPCGDTKGSIALVIQDTSQCPSDTHYIPPVRVGGVSTENGLRFWAKAVERI